MGSLEMQQRPADASTERLRSEPYPAGTTIARYRLTSFIGSGAMGDVYRAHDRALDREVALKVLPPELVSDRERVRRFAQEARAASALSHPHIVTIHEVGHARPTLNVRPIDDRRGARRMEAHYIAMELIDGQTLREALASGIPTRRALELLAQVADGLGKAHGAGIIHRDLKPDNILISHDGYAKIVDFGLAKLIDTSWNPIGADSPTLRALTTHGELLGTPGYMAPEQISGKLIDPRADIFAFGCMLYETIAHARAFQADSFIDTLYKIMHEEPVALSAHVPDVSPELERIVSRCLAKDREERYQSIRDAAADLRSATAMPAPRSRRRQDVGPFAAWKPALLLVAILPVLAWIFMRDPAPPTTATQTVQRITSDGRAELVTIAPDGRYVAYVTSGPKGATLFLEQVASGATLVVVPPSPEYHYAGISFSPDGEQLYFTRYDNDTIANLQRVSILGGAPQAILRDIDTRVAISPDGKNLAFVRDDINRATSLLMVANADGSNVRTLAPFRFSDRVWSPAWSPDGKKVVVVHQTRLAIVSFPKGEVRNVEPSVDFSSFRGVVWPEKDRLIAAAAVEESGGRSRLWTIDPVNGETSALTSELTELLQPVVSSDGAIAALQVIREANLIEVRADGSTKALTTGVGASNGLSGVAWLEDRIVYASSADGRWDLWTLADGNSRRLTDDSSFESQPIAAPDGSALFYISSTMGRTSIWRMLPDGSDRVELTSSTRLGDFGVSPDSKRIAFAAVDEKTKDWGLWTMTAKGESKRRIATRANILQHIRYAPDGGTIYFTGYDDSALRLFRISADGGPIQPMLDRRAHSASFSSDGTTIAATAGTGDSWRAHLALIPAKGGPAKILELEGSMYRWKPDGSAISFLRRDNGLTDLWLQPRDGGAPRKLASLGEASVANYAWSPDSSRVVLAQVKDAVDVVVIR